MRVVAPSVSVEVTQSYCGRLAVFARPCVVLHALRLLSWVFCRVCCFVFQRGPCIVVCPVLSCVCVLVLHCTLAS